MPAEKTITVGSFDAAAYEHTDHRGDLSDELIATDQWDDELVERQGIPIVDVPFVSVGGGIGSLVMADYLRIAGVPKSAIRVLTVLDRPWQTYQYLTGVSQIPVTERLRSDSASNPGNVWGFPGYAIREAWNEKTLAPVWNVLTEPILCDYWTPKAGQAFAEMQREADRIGYWELMVKGQVRMVRRRTRGGYFTILTPPEGTTPTKRVAYRSTYVHVAVGYPGLKFLPDLQEYRQTYHDHEHVVNAYEPHEHVYQELRRRPGTVLVRGGGIVASRVLQRLIDDRDNAGAQTQIIHLLRTYVDGAHGPHLWLRRKGGNGFAYQGFNWPKGTWGGQTKSRLEKLEGEDRKAFYDILGGTNTPKRRLWQQQLKRGRREGWYRAVKGQVVDVRPSGDGVMTEVRPPEGAPFELYADFIVDSTGLEADIREHRLLADLLDHSGAGRNPLGRLDVERSFEVRGTRSGSGRMYAVGSPTLGGYFAGVDTFLGLQYSALQVADDLARAGFCRHIGTARSISQWWKWARNERI
jgi:hypothetical protein